MISLPSTTSAPPTDLTDPSKVTPLQLVVTPQVTLGDYLSPPPSYPPGEVQTRPLNLVEGGTVSPPPLLTLPPLASLRPLPPAQLNGNELAQNSVACGQQRAGSGWGGGSDEATPTETALVAGNPHAQSRTMREKERGVRFVLT